MDKKVDAVKFIATSIRVDGHRYAVKRILSAVDDTTPTLVFLHEGLGCIKLWRDFPEQLCATTHLSGIAYDRLGHGASDPMPKPRTPRYLHDEALEYLPAFLEATGIEKPVLIGHSDGGTIALLFASYYPDNVSGLVTEAAHVFVEEKTLAGIRNTLAAYESTHLKKSLKKYHGEKTDALFYAWAHTWLSPEFRQWNIVDEIKSITVPTLIIQGVDDEYGTAQQVDAIANSINGWTEKVMIPHCGHVPHIRARKMVLELVSGFIRNKVLS